MQFNFNIMTTGVPQTSAEVVEELGHIANEIQKMNVFAEVTAARAKMLLGLLLVRFNQEIEDEELSQRMNAQKLTTFTNSSGGVDANGQLRFAFFQQSEGDGGAAQK